jgi:hypothetical protein
MKNYYVSFAFTFLCVGLAAYWGQHSGMGLWPALWLVTVLGVLEVSLSFDNAVVNAAVLKTMNPFWQKMFLTIGILVAVFGMRLVFPIVIVAVMTGMGTMEVIDLALNAPEQYGQVLTNAYPMIASFGGAFLLMVFLDFALDEERDIHWLGNFERKMGQIGKLESSEIVIALAVVIATASSMPGELQYKVMLSGVSGIILFVIISSLDGLFEQEVEHEGDGAHSVDSAHSADKAHSADTAHSAGSASGGGTAQVVARNGAMAFLYLEVLDASFSFDGVIGAFAITRDVVIIMLGLAIGAMFVRSMTVDLVRRGTLDEFIFLEHGAMYAIGVLACIMFIGTQVHVPEVLTWFIGVAFIGASLWSSIRHRRKIKAEL